MILAFRSPPFFLFLFLSFFFFTSISNYSFWHISFNRVAHRKKSNYLPFLLAFRQHRFPLFRDKEILSPIVPFIFREDNLPFLISLFIASHFESFAQRKNETSSSNRIYKTVNVKILNGSFVFKEGGKKERKRFNQITSTYKGGCIYFYLSLNFLYIA